MQLRKRLGLWSIIGDEVRRQAQWMRLLSVYRGPLRRDDGLDHYVSLWGAETKAYYFDIDTSHGLADDAFWTTVKADIEFESSVYAAAGMVMPSGTFSSGRPLTTEDLECHSEVSMHHRALVGRAFHPSTRSK